MSISAVPAYKTTVWVFFVSMKKEERKVGQRRREKGGGEKEEEERKCKEAKIKQGGFVDGRER